VTWLTLNSPAKTRQEAVELGNRIMAKFVKWFKVLNWNNSFLFE
jgi:hypothetical protein